MKIATYRNLEVRIGKKFREIDKVLKNSFRFIREDVNSIQKTVDAMRKFLKKEDSRLKYARKEDNKLREEFRRDVDDFTQKISQLRLALSEVKAIQKEVVVVKDLARIEDRIREGFREELQDLKNEVRELKREGSNSKKRLTAIEKGIVRKKKKSWKSWFGFGKKEKPEQNNNNS